MSTESLWALLDPANRADPYPLYARIRAAGPVMLSQGPTTVFASHADCLAVLRHPASSTDRRNSTVWRRRLEQLPAASPGQRIDYGTPSFLFLDPPDHTRLRRLVSSAFTPRIINLLRPFLTELIDDLLDEAAARGELELVADLAYPVPVAVICRLLGIPLADQARFRTWSELLARSLDPLVALTGAEDPETPTRMQAAEQLRHYIQELVAARRRSPGEDLITALIRVEESGEGLTEQEIISTCVLLLIAGHETTVNLIANGALALLRDIGQWQALVEDPTRAPRVVEETLRFDPPVHVVGRVARGGLELPGGARVPDGGYALLLIAAAGRDPAVLAEPDRFDPDRPEVRNLAFGMGPHFCLGAPLARLEAQLALGRLAQRVSSARLAADPPPYKANMALRGMSALPVHPGTLAPRTVPWV